MYALWQQIITLGIDSTQEEFLVKHIKLLNILAIFSGFFSLLYICIEIPYYPLTKALLVCVFLSSASFFATLWFNHQKKYLIARLVFNLSALVFISFYTIQLGAEVNAHHYFMLVIGIAYFIYPQDEKNYQRGVISLAIALFLWFELNFYNGMQGTLAAPIELLLSLKLYFNLGLLIFLVFFAHHISEHYQRAERKLALEREYSDSLLHNILPKSIVKRLKQKPEIIADRFNASTILFADIVGFTQLSEKISPDELVECLNEIFSIFDAITERYSLEKIKTIGDAYMVAGGLPIETKYHAESIAKLALDMRTELAQYNQQNDKDFQIRIGINSGVVIAGVIGIKKFVYDIWGDAVNVASRMESHGIPGEIQVSDSTYQLLKEEFELEYRGLINVKGKGDMAVYLLKSNKK